MTAEQQQAQQPQQMQQQASAAPGAVQQQPAPGAAMPAPGAGGQQQPVPAQQPQPASTQPPAQQAAVAAAPAGQPAQGAAGAAPPGGTAGAAAAAQQPSAAAAAGAPAGGAAAGQPPGQQPQQPPLDEAAELRQQEDALLAKAFAIKKEWMARALAYGHRHEDPIRPLTHWDFLLKEVHWMARDFGQERMWKRRVAYHLGHAAAAEGRRRLEAAAAAREAAAKSSGSGRGSKAKKEEAEQAHREHAALLDVLDMAQPQLNVTQDDLLYWANDGEFTQCVVAHLEHHDVTKLLRCYHYNARCEADLEVAWLQAENRAAEERKAEAQPVDDDPLAKRGKRKAGAGAKGARGAADMEEDGLDDSGRPHPAYAGRDKRKRKQARDYEDDDYVAGNKGGRGPMDARGGRMGGALVRSGSDMSLPAGGDARMAKRLKSQLGGKPSGMMDGSGRLHPHQLAAQRSGLIRGASVVPHNWGYDDDALLTALVVEYGFNWHFIADTCSSTCCLQGVTRRSEWCKLRHQQIKQAGEAAAASAEQGAALGPDGQPLDGAAASVANLVNLTKQQAKELIMRSLPVPEGVLKRHADAITPVAAKKKTQMIQDRDAVRKQNSTLQEPHMSHFKLTQQALAQSNGRILNPLEITEAEEQQRRALQRQQELERAQLAAQQQAAAAQQAAQQQAAAAAAAAAAQQQMQQQGGGAMGVMAAGGMQQMTVQQQQQMAAAMAVQGMPGQAGGLGMGQRSGSMPGAGILPQGSNAAAQAAAAAAAAAQQRAPGGGGTPGGMAARGPSSSGGLTPEQQQQMLLMQQQQAALAQQQRAGGAGQQAVVQQQQAVGGMQAASPGQQQQAALAQQRVQQYAQQQAQQQLAAQQRMAAGYQMQQGGAAVQGMGMTPAQMAAAQAQMAAGQLNKANSGQLQQAPGGALTQQQLAMQQMQMQQAGAMPGAQGMMWPQMQQAVLMPPGAGNPAAPAGTQPP